MKNTYQIFLKQPNANQHLVELFEILEASFSKFNIKYALIGAFVRDIWLTHIHQTTEKARATKDIDFVLDVAKIQNMEMLRNYLIENKGFLETNNKFRLIYEGNEVDLIPFGGIETEENYQQWVTGNPDFKKISTLGLREASDNGFQIKYENNQTLYVVSLESLVMLKIIAWNDRPEHRQKDAEDINYIINHYFINHTKDVYESDTDVLLMYGTENLYQEQCGARVIGRRLNKITQNNKQLWYLLQEILKRETAIANQPISRLAFAMNQTTSTYEANLHKLNALLKGFND